MTTQNIIDDRHYQRLLRTLNAIDKKVARKVIRSALGRSLTIVLRGMKQAVPPATTPGHDNRSIKNSLGRKNKKGRRSGTHEAKAGVGVGSAHKKQVPYAQMLAAGTNERATKKGARRGRVRKHPFVRDGFNATREAARRMMIQGVRDGLEREVRKLRAAL